MHFHLIFSMLITSCGLSPSGSEKAIMDEHHALGMVVAERDGVKVLKMLVCEVKDNLPPTKGQITQPNICKNAFIDAEGKEYYFSDLANRELKQDVMVKGYTKLGALLLVPVIVGTALGFNAKWLISNLKIIITDDLKILRDKGAQNAELVHRAREDMYKVLNRRNDTTAIGGGTGLIMSIVGHSHLHDLVWGKGERKVVTYWKDVFKVHNYSGSLSESATYSWDISFRRTQNRFEDATFIADKSAIKDVVQTIATGLGTKVNPTLNFQR